MPNLAKLQQEAAKFNAREINTNAVIDDAATKQAIKDDYAQYDGIALKSPYTTLQIDYASFDGSANNAITIAIDGGGTHTTVSVLTDLPGGVTYHKALFKNHDGSDNPSYHVTSADAYGMMRQLKIHLIMQ